MRLRDLAEKLRIRASGLPRSPREFDRVSLFIATMRELGWYASVVRRAPIDASGSELPWFTYPAIFWLQSLLRGDERVFEYGAGNSSLWFAERAAAVTSVDHDEKWAEVVRARRVANLTVLHRTTVVDEALTDRGNDPYVDAVAEELVAYDIIVVDGINRNACLVRASAAVADSGLIILDNSNRPTYQPGIEELEAKGFSRVDLAGPLPGNTRFGCTSFFCRDFGARTAGQGLPSARLDGR